MSISTVIITRNEEINIQSCIESVIDFSNEIIIVDSFSTDKTKAIALKYSQVVFFEREFDTYISQKNYANNLARFEFILSLDADETLDDNLIDFFKTKKYQSYDAVRFHRLNKFGNKFIRFGIWKNDYKIRLWKKEKAYWAGSNPHEHLELEKNAQVFNCSSGYILHNAYSNYLELQNKSKRYAQLAASDLKSRSYLSLIISLLINPLFKFIKGFVFLQGYRDGIAGWQIAKNSFIETVQKYYFAVEKKINSTDR